MLTWKKNSDMDEMQEKDTISLFLMGILKRRSKRRIARIAEVNKMILEVTDVSIHIYKGIFFIFFMSSINCLCFLFIIVYQETI